MTEVKSWDSFKEVLSATSGQLIYLSHDASYEVFCVCNSFTLRTVLDKAPSDTTALDDFEANFKANANKKLVIQSVVTSQPDPAPFATPAYRTKRSKNSEWTTCPADSETIIDYQMVSEMYVHGGMFMYHNAKEGDYISAEVYDKDSVIPSPYRAGLCEAWPSVAKYIVGAWLLPTEGYMAKEENTYPLNAKISAGLYLRITYHATSEAGDRKAAINYFLTKKL